MKQHLNLARPAMAALFAAVVIPTAPVFAQDTLTASPPPVIAAPPPVTTAPAPPPSTAPTVTLPRTTPAPTARIAPLPAPAPTARATPRTTTRTATTRTTTTRTSAPARAPAPAASPAPAPAPAAQAPVEAAPAPAPVETTPPAAAPVETATTTTETQTQSTRSILPWLIGGAALLALLAGFFLFRRRRTDEVYEETYYAPAPAREIEREPTFVAPIDVSPVAAEPVFVRPVADPVPEPRPAAQPVADEQSALPPPEEIAVAEADHADVEALAASSEPVSGRPWLEFLMRPMRAGTNRDNTIVQFELTVGNTGDVPARDVRISTWVVAAGEGTDYERSLIDPPADAAVEQVSIDAGEGATVEAKIGLAKDGTDESVLPVVVADARYTLPDGTEGRTHASFAVGVPAAESGELQPFLTDRSSGLRENVEARLYGEPERV
jgi:Meckel syndrome type 1 protein